MAPKNSRYGSNNAEMCPACFEVLHTRFGATSHYRAHVRKGELAGRALRGDKHPRWFKLVDQPDQAPYWWDRGPGMYRDGTANARPWAERHKALEWLLFKYNPHMAALQQARQEAELLASGSKFVFMHIDYDVPYQHTYRAVQVKLYGDYTTAKVASFATGDPVADYDAAHQWIADQGYMLEWGPSNVVDWLNQGTDYTMRAAIGTGHERIVRVGRIT